MNVRIRHTVPVPIKQGKQNKTEQGEYTAQPYLSLNPTVSPQLLKPTRHLITTIGKLNEIKFNLPLGLTIFIRLIHLARSSLSRSTRHTNSDISIRKLSRIMASIILNKPQLRTLNPLRRGGESISTDMDLPRSDRVNDGSAPGRTLVVLDVDVVSVSIAAGELDRAANAGTAVGAVRAVGVVGGRARLEAGECGVDYGGAI